MDGAQFCQYVDEINATALTSLLLSLGKELGLFDVMIEQTRPLTSRELADLAGMKERYVRELLNGLAAASLVQYDADNQTFFIPVDHFDAFKARAALSCSVAALGIRTPAIKDCFMKDGPHGIGFDYNESFWDYFTRWRNHSSVDIVDNCIVPKLKGTPVGDRLESGVRVLDACCGSGEMATRFAKCFPKSSFTAVELYDKPRSMADENVKQAGLTNIQVISGSILDLPADMTATFDVVIMIDSLHDLPDPHKALAEMYKVLKPDGTLILQDLTMSSNVKDNIGNRTVSMFYACSLYVCLPSSLSGPPRVGYGKCWGRQNIEAAIKEKFNIEQVVNISTMNDIYICRLK